MASNNDYEEQLRSFVEERTQRFQSSVENIARNRANLSANALEGQLEREADKLKEDVTDRINAVQSRIKSYRPTDERRPDYGQRMEQYRQFVTSSSTAIQKAAKWIDRIFEKIINMVKQTVQFIVDRANDIISVLEMIRDAFRDIFALIPN